MKTAVTLCQVGEAQAGPFVFHEPLPEAFAMAAALGFDAVELFLPSADFISTEDVRELAEMNRLSIAAVGTGAGMLVHGLSVTDPSAEKRAEAIDFVEAMIDFGGRLGAPAILGSMQGKWGVGLTKELALQHLATALRGFGKAAARHQVPFIYEPLNRYESNLIKRLAEAVGFIEHHQLTNVVLLADLFHMNLEEADLAAAIRAAGRHLGHVHYADSNRSAMGLGHTAPSPILAALREISYQGYLSAEIFPLPDPRTAAALTLQSINAFRS
jgi:sugar phosphate isomerase/epimerase